MTLEDAHGLKVSGFRCGADAVIHFVIENRTDRELRGFRAAIAIVESATAQRVALLDTRLLGFDFPGIRPGRNSMRIVIPKMPLVPGRYQIRIYSTVDGAVTDWIKNASGFDVEAGDYYGTGQLPERAIGGFFLLDHQFALGGP